MLKPRILIADGHVPSLQLSRSLLEGRYDLVGAVRDGLQLLASARRLKPDLVVTAVNIPYLGGIEACRRLKQILPDAGVVLLTSRDDRGCLEAAMRAGASGYVLKRCLPLELFRGIEEALHGRIYVTPLLEPREEPPRDSEE